MHRPVVLVLACSLVAAAIAACGPADRTTAPNDASAVPSQTVVAAEACARPTCLSVSETTTRSLDDGLCLTVTLANDCAGVTDAFLCLGRKRDDRPADSQCWSYSLAVGGRTVTSLCHATGHYSLAAGDPAVEDTAALRDQCARPD